MKHIFVDESGIVQFEAYFEYLKTVKEQMPPHVYQFASDSKYYNLDSHSSLHDAWLDYFNIIERAEGDRKQFRTIEIEARFLGPFHDKRIYLTYKDVLGFDLKTSSFYAGNPFQTTAYRRGGHGDLSTHILTVEEDSILVHQLIFVEESSFIIYCRDIVHREEDYSYK